MGTLSLGRLTLDQRLDALREAGVIDDDGLALLEQRDLRQWGSELSGLAENVIGAFPVPLGIATHFVINGEPRLIPMATEERSVIAAASKAAKLCPNGFTASIIEKVGRNYAQILYADLDQPELIHEVLRNMSPNLLDTLRKQRQISRMAKYGGGLRVLRPKLLPNKQVVVDLAIDTGEAMGANIVTKMAEDIANYLDEAIGARRTAVICSNNASGWNVRAEAEWTGLDPATMKKILAISEWAQNDPNRACTHNKGIMNAVTAIALAAGQDTRAIEASCHGSACGPGGCKPLGSFLPTERKTLWGCIYLHLPVGTVGGATSHPIAALCRKIMGVSTSEDLACVMAAAGLAQNFGALRALADEGIPESHRRLSAERK